MGNIISRYKREGTELKCVCFDIWAAQKRVFGQMRRVEAQISHESVKED